MTKVLKLLIGFISYMILGLFILCHLLWIFSIPIISYWFLFNYEPFSAVVYFTITTLMVWLVSWVALEIADKRKN